jgi:hypothetical protein
MTTTNQSKRKVMQELKDMGKVIEGLVDELRVQVHLGVQELEHDAGPYLIEVSSASRSAGRDLVKRGRALRAQLKRIRADHKRS